MNHPHLPRSFIVLLFILVAVTFFIGTLRTFAPAHAETVLEDQVQKADLPSVDSDLTPTATSTAEFPSLEPTPTPPPVTLLPPPTEDETSLPTPAPTFTPTPIPASAYADTTGIVALAILMVVVLLVGLAWGGRSPRKKKEPKK